MALFPWLRTDRGAEVAVEAADAWVGRDGNGEFFLRSKANDVFECRIGSRSFLHSKAPRYRAKVVF